MSEKGPGSTRPATASQRRELLARLLSERARRASISFSQERLWLLDRLVPGQPVYNVPAVVRLSGPLRADALERGLREIIARHEVLRTGFERSGTGPVPVIHPQVEWGLAHEDVGDAPADRREDMALARANEEARRPFDLEHPPLLRALLLRLGAEDHLLVLTLHHIVAEGWSIALLFSELEVLYGALLADEFLELEPLPLQYGDYARWQRDLVEKGAFQRELDYWRERLGGDLPILELPADRGRPPVQGFGGGWRERSLAPGLEKAAVELARSSGATLFMVMLAAYQALLARYTGEEDILVGSPIAGRNRAEAEQLIGVFINTLVMRTDLSGDPTFDQLLERVRETAVGAFSHQEIPFERVVEAVDPARHLEHTPVFQVLFAMQNTPLPTLHLAGLAPGRMLGPADVHNGTTKVDLALFVEQRAEGVYVGCEYSSDLFEPGTIDSLLGHYETLLAGAVRSPGTRLSRLLLLTADERHRIVEEWNDTGTPYPRQSVHELFEDQAARSPETVAVAADGVSLTYAELDQRANRLARFLRGQGVSAESRVGVCLERCPELIVCLLAVLKAGAAYLPLDPEYPPSRLALMVDDADAEVVLTDASLMATVPTNTARVVRMDREPWQDESAEPLALPVHPDRLAYVMYTSGSTGRPKGIEVRHRSIVRLVRETDYASFGADEVFLQLAPIAFDASTLEIWGALLNGARLYIHPPGMPSLDGLSALFESGAVTTVWLTAPLFHKVVDHRPEALGGLRQLLAGGDVLDPARVRTALGHMPGGRLINGYGPTENTTFTCCHPMAPGDDLEGTVPIGRAIRNTRVYVLDRHMQPVPVGVPGELYVAGDGLARGYLGRPGLTASKFVPDPFSAEPGGRLYRTGDRVRLRAGGHVEFLGREDFQVKVRGFRIELGEIETALSEMPEVREAVVVAREDGGEGKRLVAYYVPAQPHLAKPELLRERLREDLPDYMLPSLFVPLDELPLVPSGKIDRGALPAPSGRPESDQPYEAPVEGMESTIAGLWQTALGVERVSRDDRFFELGGHSLMLVEVHSRLGKALDLEIPLVDLFRYPTVRTLAAHLQSLASEERVTHGRSPAGGAG